jgi:cytochrome b pre-mRNA-processing protein 6
MKKKQISLPISFVMTSKSTIQQLYRQFLRLADRWPNDPLRPKANFRVTLRQTIKDRFREPIDSNTLQTRLQQAKEQLKALELILNNTYKEAYPLSKRILRPASNPTYYEKLLSELDRVQKYQGTKLAFLRRFFRF